ncbi:MAG TPA: hypothetical protein VFM18_15010 [Methanosarcina sp.]|nr:hypothetical protein [Methanosarcina sp.]
MAYIIGSIHKQTGNYSVSESPAQQPTISAAEKEAKRLALKFPEKDFIVLKLESITSVPTPVVTVRKL